MSRDDSSLRTRLMERERTLTETKSPTPDTDPAADPPKPDQTLSRAAASSGPPSFYS